MHVPQVLVPHPAAAKSNGRTFTSERDLCMRFASCTPPRNNCFFGMSGPTTTQRDERSTLSRWHHEERERERETEGNRERQRQRQRQRARFLDGEDNDCLSTYLHVLDESAGHRGGTINHTTARSDERRRDMET